MPGRIEWGYDAQRAGGVISFILTETGGVGPTIVSLSGRYMHTVSLRTIEGRDPETGEPDLVDLEYDVLSDALKTALDAAGNATYTVTFNALTRRYTITAAGGGVTAISLTSPSRGARRMLGGLAASSALVWASTYDVWHYTSASVGGWSEWQERERDVEAEDLIASDGTTRGLCAVGAPLMVDFVAPWEPASAVWNRDATENAWTWERAFARCRTVEPIAVEDPRAANTWLAGYLRADSATLRPRLPSSDYVAHQSIPVGMYVVGVAKPFAALLTEDGDDILAENGDTIII
jgi:hypothetical protein